MIRGRPPARRSGPAGPAPGLHAAGLLLLALLPACLRSGFLPEGSSDGSLPDQPFRDLVVQHHDRPSGEALRDQPAVLHYLDLEAESGALKAPFLVMNDAAASGGQYVLDQWTQGGFQTDGEVRLTLLIPTASTYYLFARTRAHDQASDSFLLTVGSGPEQTFTTSSGGFSGDWHWVAAGTLATDLGGGPVPVIPYAHPLAAGTAVVVFRSRESLSVLDRVLLTNDPGFTP